MGHEILLEHLAPLGLALEGTTFAVADATAAVEFDLKHANDLITPVAALLALGGGGSIRGAEHAAFKETDRTHGTVSLLAQFGLMSTYEGGQLNVPVAKPLHNRPVLWKPTATTACK